MGVGGELTRDILSPSRQSENSVSNRGSPYPSCPAGLHPGSFWSHHGFRPERGKGLRVGVSRLREGPPSRTCCFFQIIDDQVYVALPAEAVPGVQIQQHIDDHDRR
jgi:hypothetical protein